MSKAKVNNVRKAITLGLKANKLMIDSGYTPEQAAEEIGSLINVRANATETRAAALFAKEINRVLEFTNNEADGATLPGVEEKQASFRNRYSDLLEKYKPAQVSSSDAKAAKLDAEIEALQAKYL